MADKITGVKCLYPNCKQYFTQEFAWQQYGPECEKKALREGRFSKPSNIKTSSNTIVQNVSNQKKKRYRRKIEDAESEIKRLKANYFVSFRGQYNNLDNDLQKVLNSFRESCDHFANLLYEKYEGDCNQVKLYFNLSPLNKDGVENHCFNVECRKIWDETIKKLDLQKLQVIFDIQNKGKHTPNAEVSFEVVNFLKIGYLFAIHKDGAKRTLNNCQVNNCIFMLNQDYDADELICLAAFPFLGWKREDIKHLEYSDIQGSIAGVSKNPANQNSFVKVLNPKDNQLYDVEELLVIIENTLNFLNQEAFKL